MKIWDDYDDCIIGVGTRSGMVDVFIYDKHRMITKLVKRDDMSYDEAKEFIDSYFKRFPRIRDYMEEIKSNLEENGYVETLFNRRIYISGTNIKNQRLRGFAERQAINAPIQGTAADIIKRAMIRLPAALAKRELDADMLLQVHDELIFEIHEDELDEVPPKIEELMESAFEMDVPLKVEAGIGKNWLEAH